MIVPVCVCDYASPPTVVAASAQNRVLVSRRFLDPDGEGRPPLHGHRRARTQARRPAHLLADPLDLEAGAALSESAPRSEPNTPSPRASGSEGQGPSSSDESSATSSSSEDSALADADGGAPDADPVPGADGSAAGSGGADLPRQPRMPVHIPGVSTWWWPEAGGVDAQHRFKFTPKVNASGTMAWECTCYALSHRGHGTTRCTRTRSFWGPESDTEVLRALKWWCLQGIALPHRQAHKEVAEPDVATLPSDADLDAQLMAHGEAEPPPRRRRR